MVKISMKSNETIDNHTNLQDINAFKYAFLWDTPVYKGANHGWANLLSLLKLYPTLQRVGSKSCVIYSKDQLQLTGTIFWYDGCEGP